MARLNPTAKIVEELTPTTEPYVYVYNAQKAMLDAMSAISRRYTEFALKYNFQTAAQIIDDELKEARKQLAVPSTRKET